MVNTIWKENFLIMCSKLCLNARDSGHFAQLLLICRNYSLRLSSLWLPLETRHHSSCPLFSKRRVWNYFSISLLVRYIILSLSCRFFRRVGVGKSVNCLSVFPTGRDGFPDGWLQLVGFLGPGQIEVIPPGLSV